MVLLDGGRGSGKSTVLLSLVRIWAAPWDPRLEGSPGGPDELDAWRQDRLEMAVPDIVPLDILDLQTLPSGASLLFRVAGLFQRIVAATGSPARASHEGARPKAARTREAWRRLVTAIAMGWEGGTKGRSQSVDPEIFALELERAEKQGLDVAIEFRRFIDDLASAFKEQHAGHFGEREPLFVVPIDDADMNPERTPELVQLLRLIWHPRVAFLLAGKTDHFLAALERAYRAGSDAAAQDEARVYAQELFGRVVPPDQRLSFPTLREGLRGRLTHAGLKNGVDAKASASISDLLSRISLPPKGEGSPLTLWAAFERNPMSHHALPGILRELQDLRNQLERIVSLGEQEKSSTPLWWIALEAMWAFILRRQSFAVGTSKQVKDMLQFDDGLILAAGDVEWNSTASALHRFLTTNGALVLSRWYTPQGRLASDPKVEVSPNIAALLLIAADLVADGHGSFVGTSPAIALARRGLVTFELESESNAGRTVLPWPLPTWEASWPYLQFANLWRRTITSDASFGWRDPDRLIRTALTYLHLLGEIVDPHTKTVDQALPVAVDSIGVDPVQKLKLLTSSSASSRAAAENEFARTLMWLLCEPTSGLDQTARTRLKELVSATQPNAGPTDEALRASTKWHYRAAGVSRAELDVIREHLNPRVAGAAPTETPVETHEDPWKRFLAACAALNIPKPTDYLEPPPSLAYYLDPERFSQAFPWADEIPKEDLVLASGRLEQATKAGQDVFTALRSLDENFPLRGDAERLGLNSPSIVQRSGDLRVGVRSRVHDVARRPFANLLAFLRSNVESDLANDAETFHTPQSPTWVHERLPLLLVGIGAAPELTPWPAVDWAAPVDRQLLLTAWGTWTPSARSGQVSLEELRQEMLNLACSYLWGVYDIATTRRVTTARKPSVDTLLRAVLTLHNLPLERESAEAYEGPRSTALQAFAQLLPLIATPEALLPVEAADVVLRHLPDPDEFLRCDSLRKQAGEFDRFGGPTHPWIVRRQALGVGSMNTE